jgi:hypothetical protein
MRKIITALALGLTLAACSGQAEEKPGNPAVYQRIEQTTDCAQLQKEFDTANKNHDRTGDPAATGYMVAADERMKAVGC